MFESFKRQSPSARFTPQTRTDATLIQRFVKGLDITDGSDEARIVSPYSQHVSVFRCIATISTSLSSVPFVIYEKNKPLTSGPIFELFKRPNQLMSGVEFINTVITNLHVHGNAFIYIDEVDSKGIPLGLYPIPPRMVRPIRGKFLYELTGWEIVTSQNQITKVDPHNMLHLWYAPNPDDPILGIGPMQVAWLVVNTDYSAAIYNQSVLKSGGMPAGLLTYKGPGRLTEDMKEEVRQSWTRTYGGPRSGSRLAVTNNDWAFQATGAANRDMEFMDSRKWNLADISRAFNVPLMYLNDQEKSGLGDAGLRVTQRQFYNENIVPLGKKLETIFNERFFGRLGKNIKGYFDFTKVEALREDYAKKVESAEKLSKMGFTINSLNRKLGLEMEAMPHGDDFFVLGNMVPAQDVIDGTAKLAAQGENPNKQDGTELSETKKLNDTKQIEDKSKKEDTKEQDTKKEDPEVKEKPQKKPDTGRWYKETEEISEIKDRCQGKLRRVFMKQRANTLEIINRMSSDPSYQDSEFGVDKIVVAESIIQHLVAAYVEGVESALRELGNGPISEDDKPEVIKEAGVYADLNYDELLRIGDELSRILSSVVGTSDFDSAVSMRKVRDIYNKITKRSELIARAYVFRAYNSARFGVFDKYATESTRWLCSPDSECGHDDNDGVVCKFGSRFASGHRYPGDLSSKITIGCDCITVTSESIE